MTLPKKIRIVEVGPRMKMLDAPRYQAAFGKENRVFHSINARASGNKLLEVFRDTISILAAGTTATPWRRRWKATSAASKTECASATNID